MAVSKMAQNSRLKAQSTKASLRFNNIRRLRRLTQIKLKKEIMLKAEGKME
jgi:hypothetical protein